MYSQLCLPHSIVIYYAQLAKRFYMSSKGKVQSTLSSLSLRTKH